MESKKTSEETLEEGEYLLKDPAILDNMRLAVDVLVPGSNTILVSRYTSITARLIERLSRRNIIKVFAETVVETSIVSTAEYMEKTFAVIDGIFANDGSKAEDVTEVLRNKLQMKSLEQLMRDNLNNVEDLLHPDSTEKLVALTKHHNSTARHSLIAAFQLMSIGREMAWNDTKIVKAALALLNHDIGKSKINLETLNWPGRLNSKQWKEIQFHSLFGGRMLFEKNKKPDLIMLSALLHHEWYAEVEGKGYGGLTLFSHFVKRAMKFEVRQVVSEMDDDELEIIQITCLADMISALEESRSYKRGLDSFKVQIIMNSDAQMGHFHPVHYAAWHRVYQRQNPTFLPKMRRMALPREKERRIFTTLPPKAIPPTPLLTYYDMEKMGLLTALSNVGMDMERIRRRGGLAIKVLENISQEKNLDLDMSEAAFQRWRINQVKTQLVREMQIIELEAWREWLTVKELEKSGLMGRARSHHFNIDLIRSNGGISPDRLEKRGVTIPTAKLERMGIKILKSLNVQLPGSENRLTANDLKKLGISDVKLKSAGCYERVTKVKSGVPLEWLTNRGILINRPMLAKSGIDPIRKVFYDIQVVKEINSTRAIFRILREGDDPQELETLSAESKLEPIQDLLLNQVGEVMMDFTDLLALPDLSHVKMGSHWGK